MTRNEFEEIKSMVERAQSNIEEIRKARTEAQNNIRQLDLNEAGWLGALEALSGFYQRGLDEFGNETAPDPVEPEAED